MLDSIAKAAGDGYPPYDIERISPVDGQNERIRIVLAIAGFTRDQLEVLVEDNQFDNPRKAGKRQIPHLPP